MRLGLLLAEVGRANNITVAHEEMNRAVVERARRFPGQEREVLEYYRNNPQALDGLRAPILEEKVVDFIFEMAKVTDRMVPAEELVAAVNEEALARDARRTKTARTRTARTRRRGQGQAQSQRHKGKKPKSKG